MRRSTLMRLKRRGNGSHSNSRRASFTKETVRAGSRVRNPATSSAAGTSASAAGSARLPGATASAIARSVRSSAAPSPGARLQPGAAGSPTLPARCQSSSEANASDPSTIPFSRYANTSSWAKKTSDVTDDAALPAASASSIGR